MSDHSEHSSEASASSRSGSASCGTSKASDLACLGGVKVSERHVMGSEREGEAARRGLRQFWSPRNAFETLQKPWRNHGETLPNHGKPW